METTKPRKNRKPFTKVLFQVWELNRTNDTEEMLKSFKYRKAAERYIEGAGTDDISYEIREFDPNVL